MLYKFKKPISSLLIFLGFIICLIKFFPWVQKRLLYLPTKIDIIRLSNSQNCDFEMLNKIPNEKVSLIIGHAYGSPTANNNFLSPKLESFLIKNQYKIDTIFFTGDLFSIPTSKKWNKLYSLLDSKTKIYISPGNHDVGVGNISRRKLFKESMFFIKDYPYKFSIDNKDFILEDSTVNHWNLSKESIKIINEIPKQREVILLRHNIPVREFISLANSKEGYTKKLPTKTSLNKIFNRELTIISGDGGAFKNLPRFFCNKFGKITFLINGIGDLKNDNILVLHKKKLFRFELN